MIARVGGFTIAGGSEGPVTLAWEDGHPAALVEIFTAAEQRARTSQAYARSAVGARLRLENVDAEQSPDADTLTLVQRDPLTGLEVTSTLALSGTAVRVQHTLRGTAPEPVVVTAVSSATIGVGAGPHAGEEYDLLTARSEWLAENRWHRRALTDELPPLSLPIHAQDGRGHATLTSHGAWSTGEHLPVGALVHRDGSALAWQLESGAAWHVDLSQGLEGLTLSLLGPTDLEHQFAHLLGQGDEFLTVPVALAASDQGFEGAIAALTSHRRAIHHLDGPDLPIVYNDFMNTLMGQPSSEALRPLIRAAAEAGAEVFCIDAGWFADPEIGDWWDTVGEWQEATSRFDEAGLRGIIDEIHAAGMRSGLWLEPEVVGVKSPTAQALPDDAFFQRFGVRVREHDRHHLDFRHPAARAHLDETVDRIVRDYGVSFLKLDYNINPGAGTEWQATAAGDGLLAHIRALGDWLDDVQRRHPELLIENCSSGAMRADYALLSRTHLQSTSDQQDFRLYPPIAASAPASILPEQAGNWAYPAVGMTDAETVFTLVTGLSGRLYLSGFLGELRPAQQALVAEAVGLHTALRDRLTASDPFWPLGLPAWDAEVVCLGLRDGEQALLFVWDRSEEPNGFTIPGVREGETLFPADAAAGGSADGWTIESGDEGIRIETPSGFGARVLRVSERRS